MDDPDEIWSRATLGGGSNPRPGDAALSAALAFHGLAMNGGMLHEFEVLDADELGRARDGFAWLALTDVVQLLEATAQSIASTDWDDEEAVDALEASSDDAYSAILPSDRALEDAFRRQLAEQPDAFNPI